MQAQTLTTALSHKKHLALVSDNENAAKSALLMYVSDKDPGILRKRAGKGFSYFFNGTLVKDKALLERIKKLAIPPAWKEVWICRNEKGHIQATGYDVKKRKQYRYHPLWTQRRNETKFHKMIEFGKALPRIRLRLEKDLAGNELTERKVLAVAVSLMQRTYIRIGSSSYQKMNGSHGLTTLYDKHVSIEGAEISFSFKGKKGIEHNINLNSRRLARIVKQCRDIPGKELFQYYDKDGRHYPIDSGMVNAYIQQIADAQFSAKDFRTWAGCLHFLLACKNLNESLPGNAKMAVNMLLDEVSEKLGNTRTVCRKYYVHPGIIKLYEENKLQDYTRQLVKLEDYNSKSGLTCEETLLMKLLQKMD